MPGHGFGAPTQGTSSATIDHSKSIKKKRAPRKKPEIIKLDDAKDDVELLKHAHHWNDHWIIQLILLRGKCKTLSTHRQSKVCLFNWFIVSLFGCIFHYKLRQEVCA